MTSKKIKEINEALENVFENEKGRSPFDFLKNEQVNNEPNYYSSHNKYL